jgi:hypothetical protein
VAAPGRIRGRLRNLRQQAIVHRPQVESRDRAKGNRLTVQFEAAVQCAASMRVTDIKGQVRSTNAALIEHAEISTARLERFDDQRNGRLVGNACHQDHAATALAIAAASGRPPN